MTVSKHGKREQSKGFNKEESAPTGYAEASRENDFIYDSINETVQKELDRLSESVHVGEVERGIVASGILEQEVNDLNLGRALALCYRSRLRYVCEAERYFLFDGRRWSEDTKSSKGAQFASYVESLEA